jgi:hypothetical protein
MEMLSTLSPDSGEFIPSARDAKAFVSLTKGERRNPVDIIPATTLYRFVCPLLR